MKKLWILLVCAVWAAPLGCSEEDATEATPDAGPGVMHDVEGDGPEPDVADDVSVEADVELKEPTVFDALNRPVTLITDSTGMPHIKAESFEDLFFINGYVQAQDRFGQMEFYRRVARGTLSESFGAVSPGDTVPLDVMFRMIGIKRSADEFWQENYDPDNEAYIMLDAYAAGVNAYLAQWRAGEVNQPSQIKLVFPPDRTPDWEPTDTLAIGKLLAMDLTYAAPMWVILTEARNRILETFHEGAEAPGDRARAGFFNDVMRMAPATASTHIDGFPGINALTAPGQIPAVPAEVLKNALALHKGIADIPGFSKYQPASMDDWLSKGSNNWVLSGDLTASGFPNVANDPHLGLSMPTVFYPMHMELANDIDGREPIHIIGASYPGVPGIVIGRNDHMAWGTTVGFYDYSDVYAETITGNSDDPTPATVAFNGGQVQIERVPQTIGVGAFGQLSDQIDFTLEIVPHHGPIIPTVDGHRPVARTSSTGLSVKWVGMQPNNELEFLVRLFRATTPAHVTEALTHYTVGSSNFVFGFTSGDIYYSGRSNLPVRAPGALTFDARTNVTGTAPIFILPGDGSAEWEGFLADDQIPQALNPAKGYIITANNDQVGTTLDNNPFNDTHYLGGFYDIGFRAERIEELLTNAKGDFDEGHKFTLQDQIAIQDDGYEKLGSRVVPFIIEAIDIVLDPNITNDTHVDLASIRAEVSGLEAELGELRDLLAAWDFAGPGTRTPTGEDVTRSAATTLFNTTMVYLYRNVYSDEFARLGYYVNGRWELPQLSQILSRSILYMLETPEDGLTYDATIGDSWLFDDLGTPDVTETRLTMLVRSVLQARARLGHSAPFGQRFERPIPSPQSTNPSDWVWGNLHGLRLDGLVPGINPVFQRPSEGLPFFERPGSDFTVSPCAHGYTNFDFTCNGGSSLRMVHDLDPAGPVTYNVIPGGNSGDPGSPFFDNQIEAWNAATPHKLLSDWDEIAADAFSTVVFGE